MSQLLYPFALLACPAGMVAMMWMMNRGGRPAIQPTPDEQAELARLRAEVDQLHTQRTTR